MVIINITFIISPSIIIIIINTTISPLTLFSSSTSLSYFFIKGILVINIVIITIMIKIIISPPPYKHYQSNENFDSSGFKTPAGFFAVGSLHVLPLWFYCYESRFFTQSLGLPMWLQLSGIVVLSVGRTVCAAVEVGIYKN